MQRFDGSEIIWTFKNVGTTRTATGKIDGKVVATITNLKKGTTASDLTVDGDVITVSKNALATTAVNLNRVMLKGNYTLALADDVTKSELTKAAGWNISETSATYQTASRTKGFILAADGKSISWNAGAVSKNLTTVTGLKEGVTASDLKLNGTNVILSPNALGTTPVKINNTYNLALSADVKKSTTTAARWNVSGTTATFTNAKVTEGYVLAANKKTVTYKTDAGGKVLATLTGLKAGTLPKHITLNAKNKTITLSKNALAANSTVSLDGDYSLVLGSDVAKTRNVAAHWEINGTTAKYIAAKTVGGYKLSSDKKSVSYTAASGGNVLATLTGLKKGVTAAQLAINGNVITLPKGALGTTKVTLTGNYSLALAANVAIPKVVADAKFVVNGTTANYLSTKISAGYTLAADKKSITYSAVKGGNAVATIGGLKQGVTADKFSIYKNIITVAEGVGGTNGLTVSGKDYEFKIIPPYKVTVNGTAGAVYGGYIVDSGVRGETLIGGKGNDVLMAHNGGPGAKYNYVSGGDGNDYLHGGIGYLSATLLGGNGNDTLNGSSGTDNIRIAPCTLTGGKGNDIFVYDGGGYITVTDYTAGQDKIQCDSNSIISNLINQATVSGNDVYLNKSVNPLANNYKGTESCYLLKNAKGKKITFIDNRGNITEKTFTASAASSSAALLAEDDFATADNLSAITENNLSSVGEFETQNFDSLTQENLITYADK